MRGGRFLHGTLAVLALVGLGGESLAWFVTRLATVYGAHQGSFLVDPEATLPWTRSWFGIDAEWLGPWACSAYWTVLTVWGWKRAVRRVRAGGESKSKRMIGIKT